MGIKDNVELMETVESLEMMAQEFQEFIKNNDDITKQDIIMSAILLQFALNKTMDDIINKLGGLER